MTGASGRCCRVLGVKIQQRDDEMGLIWNDRVKTWMVGWMILVLASLTACSSSGGGDPVDTTSYGWIAGEVDFGMDGVDKTHVTGALITVRTIPGDSSQDEELESYTTVVDSLGMYRIKVPVGNYSMIVEGAGATKAYATVSVGKDETTGQNFMLSATAILKGRIDHPDMGYGTVINVKNTNIHTTCGTNGEFIIYDMPLGTFILSVEIEYYSYYFEFQVSVVPGVNDVGIISDFTMFPEVVYASVRDGAVITHDDLFNFHFRFSTSMDEETTSHAITVTAGSVLNDVKTIWDYDRYVYLNLFELLDGYYGPVSIKIGTDALSSGGVALTEPITLNFEIADKIIETYPTDGYKFMYVSNYEKSGGLSSVRVMFSDSVVPSTFQFTIEPELAEAPFVEWEADDYVEDKVVVIQGNFKAETEYTVTVTSAATERGAVAMLPCSFSFKTTKLKIIESYPADEAEDVGLDQPLYIRFNGKMDRLQVNQCLLIKDLDTNQIITPLNIEWSGNNPLYYGETMQVVFDASFGKRYGIELAGAQSANGTVLDDFSITFTTLTPKVVSATFDSGRNLLKLTFNTEVNWERSDFILDRVPEGIQSDIITYTSRYSNEAMEGCGTYVYILPEDVYSPDNGYRLSWVGLTALSEDNEPYSIYPGEFYFKTEPLTLLDTSPGSGSVNVKADIHSVSYMFSGGVEETMRGQIESLLTVTAEHEGTVTSVTPTLFWERTDYRQSVLHVDFIFDYETTYTLKIDTSQDQVLKEVLNSLNPVVFSTSTATQTQPENLFYRFSENDGVVFWDKYDGWELLVYFNEYVDLRAYPANEVITIHDSSGIPVDFTGYFDETGSITTVGSKRFAMNWSIINLPFSFGQTYKVSLTDKFTVYDPDESGYLTNLPASVKLTAVPPEITVSVNNDTGLIKLTADSGFFLSLSDVLSSLSTEPAIEIVEEIYGDGGENYLNTIGLRYKPVQTAHLQVSTGALHGYRELGESHFSEACIFRNTPYSQVYSIEPDVVQPELNQAYALDEDTVYLLFNTDLDSESAKNLSHYTITDEDGTTVPVQNIILTLPSSSAAPGEDYVGPVGSVVKLETSVSLMSSPAYTATVSGITEWGGNYTIAGDKNSIQFPGYGGVLESVTAYSYTDYSFVGEERETTYTKVIPIVFDVPVDTEDAESKFLLEIKSNSSDSYHAVSPESLIWNSEGSAAAIRVTWTGNVYGMRLSITGHIQNAISGNDVFISDYTRNLNTGSSGNVWVSCYNYSDDPSQVRVSSYGLYNLAPETYSYTLYHPTQNTVFTGVALSSTNSSIIVEFNETLELGQTYIMKVGGFQDPDLVALGLGAATPSSVADYFTF